MDKAGKIGQLNDAFRRSGCGGKILLTSSIRNKSHEDLWHIFQKIKTFDNFNGKNAPYGSEHNFGCFDYNGENIMWKIDYYSPDMKYFSEDPSDPQKTIRTLTIMHDFDLISE